MGGTLIVQGVTNQAGTLGMVVTVNGADRWMLTCRHVVARRDGSIVGTDALLQPDAANGAIAQLAGSRVNTALDCVAIPSAIPASTDILGVGRPSAPRPPVVGMRVIKASWKTGVTEGLVRRIGGDDVVIERRSGYPNTYLLAALGDSGAIWMDSMTLAPVAMHTSESTSAPHEANAVILVSVFDALDVRQI